MLLKQIRSVIFHAGTASPLKRVLAAVVVATACSFNIFSISGATLPDDPDNPASLPDSIPYGKIIDQPGAEVVEELLNASRDSATLTPVDSAAVLPPSQALVDATRNVKVFNPDPTRAVWLSALFPGLGQIYNRRYWKLPIVVGAFMGLGYGMQWNSTMLGDYTRAYNELMDSDPNTNSYMDFFPPSIKESDLDRKWLEQTFKARKDYARRNRDLCVICMVGVYLVAMVDAYVDASLAHFDISPDLSVDWSPTIIPDTRSRLPGLGLQWALTF